jgi:hypothetical protein
LKKDERMADLRMIFTEEKGHKNAHTGESEDGWWCNVCKCVLLFPVFESVFLLTCLLSHREANLPLQNCFFKGSISTRRTHIARNPNCHFPIYKSRCEEKGIIMHERAIPLNVKVSDGGQRTLDRALVPKPPQFTKAGLVDYIVELIVAEDEVCDFHYFFLSFTYSHNYRHFNLSTKDPFAASCNTFGQVSQIKIFRTALRHGMRF